MAATHQHQIFAASSTPTPKRRLHTASRQTRMAATHQRKNFRSSYCGCPKRRIKTKFLKLLLAQLPRTTFTHSKLPNPHGCPFKALSPAPAKQTEAAGQRRPARRSPVLEALSIPPATQTEAAGPAVTSALQPLPQSLKALSTAPATQTKAAGQRQPARRSPVLEALSIPPATQTEAAGPAVTSALQPLPQSLKALSTAPATQTKAAGQRQPARRSSSRGSKRLAGAVVWWHCFFFLDVPRALSQVTKNRNVK